MGTADEALVDDIADRIRVRIMNGEIPIGAPLRQAALAAEFGVSRTPVREALRQLQNGGLITMAPNRGAVVRVPAPWEVRYAYEVRAELEGLAAARAAANLTHAKISELRRLDDVLCEGSHTADANDAFHTIICDSAANPWLTSMVERINESFPRSVSRLAAADDENYRQKNVEQHEQILEAIVLGDAELARARMRSHIMSAGDHLASWYERRSATVLRH
ncbi:GntR family transcriptional regulator [Nocardia miyunensis]|uniref:GntR family transcriptional regulator n=1 Tax=Nocardia miyunensis TaxID=282684 RepID=UPI00082FEF97|nr:GntR family transcriptional regulator [Nocardia miyunensis]